MRTILSFVHYVLCRIAPSDRVGGAKIFFYSTSISHACMHFWHHFLPSPFPSQMHCDPLLKMLHCTVAVVICRARVFVSSSLCTTTYGLIRAPTYVRMYFLSWQMSRGPLIFLCFDLRVDVLALSSMEEGPFQENEIYISSSPSWYAYLPFSMHTVVLFSRQWVSCTALLDYI